MKKRILILLLLLQMAVVSNLFSQNVGINATGSMPDTSAILDVSSTSKGFLLPRMTTEQQNAIILPATGLAIFNTTLNTVQVNTGNPLSPSWSTLTTNTNTNAWSIGGNNVNSVQNFGTTGNFDLPFITNNTEKMRLSAGGNLGIGNTASDGDNAAKLLADAGTSSYNVISGKGDLNNYLQLNIKNINPGSTASSDIVATNDAGTDVNGLNYVNMGINSSNNITTGILGGANTGYLYSTGSDFSIGNASANKNLLLFTGGIDASNERMRIDNDGNIGIATVSPSEKLDVDGNIKFSGAFMPGNSAGSAGNILISNGANAAPKWTAFATGNIAETGSGVLSIAGGTGSVLGNGVSVQVKQASANQSGYLSSDDWNIFNNKLNAGNSSTTVVESFGKTDNFGIKSSLTNPTSTPMLAIGVDISMVASRNRLTGDSGVLAAAINAKGTGSVTGVSAGYGLSGGTITTSGTLIVDSATLFTTALRKKDSTLFTTVYANTLKQNKLSGTGFIKASGTTISYDNTNYLTANQTITLSGDIAGAGGSAITATLPNINANVGTFNTVTINAKGQATAGSNVTFAATAPVTYSNGLIGMAAANASTNGYLSGADWGTFNAKGNGTVTGVSVVSSNGISGSVTSTATPAITLALGAITPSSVAATGTLTGSNLSGSHTGTSSGTNTGDETLASIKTKLGVTVLSGSNSGDQTISLTGDVGGTGTAGVTTTIANNAVTYGKMQAVSTTSKLLGSSSTTTPIQEITIGSGLNLSGTTLTATSGAGAITSASIASANGLAGTVSSGTTPVITLKTSITGMVEGNGTTLSAATPGVDYAPGTASNATGFVKSTTGTGALTTASLADFPLFNQNTTGTASNITEVLNTGSFPALTGDVTKPAGSLVTTLGDDAVTNAKLANMATQTFKGKTTAGTGNPEDLTATEATAMLNTFGTAKGLVPGVASSQTQFLRADGNFAVPPGAYTGTVTSVSVTTANGISGAVATNTTTPAVTLTLGAITPSSIAATGTIAGSNLSGTNTGDETTATIKSKLGAASATKDGYLTTADWNTFNNASNNAITITSNNLTLTATHHTVIVTGMNITLTLPAANTCLNRVYIIVNETGSNVNLTNSYIGFNAGGSTSVSGTSGVTIQSNGTNWYRIQ